MTADLLASDPPVILSGVLAALWLTASPLFRSRRMVLLAQLAAGLCFAAHYAYLGIAVAAGVNLLGAVQTGAALLSTRSAAMNRLGYALIVLMAVVGLWFWQGPTSALSVAAMTLVAVARMQPDQVHLRVLLLCGGAVWAMHDLAVEAWIALAADIGCAMVGAAILFTLLFRVTIARRPSSAFPAAAAAA